ncbi:AraC family transcriptional regulator [Agathobaculum sp. LCP25S3_E8]|uniref:helix-turn-helix transcriptional regulator n=1 Tax=Agathobaculum sp. LCP25S3_E8 TaxID=3438735 RepID=UPI003F8EA3C4
MYNPLLCIDHIRLSGCFAVCPQTGGGYLPCSSTDWTLFCVQQGAAEVTIIAQTVHVHGGDFLLIPPESCHMIGIADNSRVLVVRFNGLAAPLPGAFGYLPSSDATAMRPILTLLNVGGLTGQARDCVLEALLLQLTAQPAFSFTPPPLSSLPLRVLRYLNDHFRDDLSLNDLADVFHISVSHIIHIFNPLFRLSPIQYLIRRRIGEAQLMLRCTSLSAGEIAAQVGIMNRNYFYRTFKRLTGLSPSQYRNAFYIMPS